MALLRGDGCIIQILGDTDPRRVTASLRSVVGNLRRPVRVAIACGSQLPSALNANTNLEQDQTTGMEVDPAPCHTPHG